LLLPLLSSKTSLKIPKGGNQNPYIEEQTTQWPKEKVQKDKQRSTKHTHKTKDRVTQTPLKTGGEPRCSGTTRTDPKITNTFSANLQPSNHVLSLYMELGRK
jgi:hypothetical protein